MATIKKTTSKKAAPRTKKAPEIKAGKGEAVVYAMDGSQAGTIALPVELFGVQWNADLVHQVVIGMQANARPTVAHTKFRGEVSGGGKKPWKQKGTGRARHGSTRSPIWVGGGTTHGPRAERVYSVKINKKMRTAALFSVLSRKLKDGEVIFVEKLSFSTPKTAEAKKALVAISKAANVGLVSKRKNAALIALSSNDAAAKKSFRNLGNVMSEEIRNLNPVDVMTRRYLVIENPKEALPILSGKVNKSK
ncbi:MAG: 50S ribosomal protein L4 [Patescibacteria group bacterium]